MQSTLIPPVPIAYWKNYWEKGRDRNSLINTKKQAPAQLVFTEKLIPLQLGNSFHIIMDYQQNRFLEVAGNTEQVIGLSHTELLEGGISLLFNAIDPAEQPKVAAASFYFQEFIHQQVPNIRTNLKTNLNIKLHHKAGHQVTLLEQVLVLDLNEQGEVAYTFKHFTDISHLPSAENMVLSFMNISGGHNHAQLFHTVSFAQTQASEQKLILSKAELAVLKWIAQGLASKQIAEKLHISVHTVNNHRKNMIKKTGAKNIAEVLNLALLNELI
ncbi:MAG TPA: hypothetical protein DIW54_08800 [Chitinophagaceae bacterium]|nr:hypothetical protein [Chitinophagaceae bacterium]